MLFYGIISTPRFRYGCTKILEEYKKEKKVKKVVKKEEAEVLLKYGKELHACRCCAKRIAVREVPTAVSGDMVRIRCAYKELKEISGSNKKIWLRPVISETPGECGRLKKGILHIEKSLKKMV